MPASVRDSLPVPGCLAACLLLSLTWQFYLAVLRSQRVLGHAEVRPEVGLRHPHYCQCDTSLLAVGLLQDPIPRAFRSKRLFSMDFGILGIRELLGSFVRLYLCWLTNRSGTSSSGSTADMTLCCSGAICCGRPRRAPAGSAPTPSGQLKHETP